MKLGKVTIKDGQTWITVHGDQPYSYRTVHLDGEAKSVEEKGKNIVVKMK